MGSQGALSLDDAIERIQGAREGDEEGVALRVDLVAVVGKNRRPQQVALVGQDGGILLAQALEQPRRAFDVGE